MGLAVLGLLAVAIGVRIWFGLRSQPQLPPSAEVFKAVDSLFTAVTARDQKQLAACEQRLSGYQQQGLLPAAASKRLSVAIATAKRGEWESAARRLYDFIQGQRREGSELATRPQRTAMNIKPRH
jgi:hypothetical protein